MKRIALALLACSIAFAGSKTYTLNVWQPAVLAGTELKTGQYRMEVDGDKVILKAGRQTVEANVKVESTSTKHRSTTLVMEERNGKMHIREILLGGTDTKLVVN
jgi:hypothetical protein